MYLFFFKQRFSSLAIVWNYELIGGCMGRWCWAMCLRCWAMCRYYGLWTFVRVYVPSCGSMDRYYCLCAFSRFYGLLFQSMCHHTNLWTVPFILWTLHPILWAVLRLPASLTTSIIYQTSFTIVTKKFWTWCRILSKKCKYWKTIIKYW